jgi:hypothetical protein
VGSLVLGSALCAVLVALPVDQLRESVLYPKFFAVTVVLTVFLVGAYMLVYVVAQPAFALDPRRATRR